MKTFVKSAHSAPCPDHTLTTVPPVRQAGFLVAILLFLCAGVPLAAQHPSQVDVKAYGFKAIIPDVTLQAGETVEIELKIGNWAEKVLGFQLKLELSALAATPVSLEPSMAGLWITEPGVVAQEIHMAAEPKVYTYTYDRSVPVSGEGTLLRLRLQALVSNVHAADLLTYAGGVLVVDNLDIRQAAPSTVPDFTVWPNPSKDIYQLSSNASPVVEATLLSREGRLLHTYGAVASIDLSDLPAGTYFLMASNQLGQTFCRVLYKI